MKVTVALLEFFYAGKRANRRNGFLRDANAHRSEDIKNHNCVMECDFASFLNRYFVSINLHGVISRIPVTLTLKTLTFHKLAHHKSVTDTIHYTEMRDSKILKFSEMYCNTTRGREKRPFRDHESDGHSEAGKLP